LVNWFEQSSGPFQTGTLFMSDSQGIKFSLSLSKLNRISSTPDFEELRMPSGVYLANVIVNDADSLGSTRQVQTRITFNNGSTWEQIAGPVYDINGSAMACPVNVSHLDRHRVHAKSAW
jgi:hypothetical protein